MFMVSIISTDPVFETNKVSILKYLREFSGLELTQTGSALNEEIRSKYSELPSSRMEFEAPLSALMY